MFMTTTRWADPALIELIQSPHPWPNRLSAREGVPNRTQTERVGVETYLGAGRAWWRVDWMRRSELARPIEGGSRGQDGDGVKLLDAGAEVNFDVGVALVSVLSFGALGEEGVSFVEKKEWRHQSPPS